MKPLPAGCDAQGRHFTRQWHDTIPTAYGDDMQAKTPKVVPCSTVARWWLWLRRWL